MAQLKSRLGSLWQPVGGADPEGDNDLGPHETGLLRNLIQIAILGIYIYMYICRV